MKILLCIVLLLVVLTLFAIWPGKRRDALRAPFLGRNCAHRGFFGKDQRPPENSLPAFAAAAKNGYGIELDVQFTADRRLVVFHDDTLDRMTPAKGFVHDMPWAEFSAQPLAGSDEHPPLFADMLRTVAEAKRAVRTAEGQVKDATDRREQAISSANRALDNSKARQRKVQGELDKLLADPSAKRDAIAQVRQELAAETAHVSAAETAVTRATADAQSSVDNAQTHLWTQKQSLETAQRESDAMQAEAKERRGEYDRLRSEAEARQKKLSDKIDRHKAEIERSNRLRDNARTDASKANDLLSEAKSIHDTPQATEQLRRSIAEREQTLESQRAQVEELGRAEKELRRRTRATRIAVLVILVVLVAVVVVLVGSMLLGQGGDAAGTAASTSVTTTGTVSAGA